MSQLARSVRLGRYEQLDVIGEGAYGVVYKALDHTTGEHLALKELRRVRPTSLARFKLELRTVQEVHPPNLVRLRSTVRGGWDVADRDGAPARAGKNPKKVIAMLWPGLAQL